MSDTFRNEMFEAIDRFDEALARYMNDHRHQAFRVTHNMERGDKPERPAHLPADYPYEFARVKSDSPYDIWAVMTIEKVTPITPEIAAMVRQVMAGRDVYPSEDHRLKEAIVQALWDVMEGDEG